MRTTFRQPAWAWAVAGFLAASLALDLRRAEPEVPAALAAELAAPPFAPPATLSARSDLVPPPLARALPPQPLARAGVRALRRLPGIGDRRANAIVRARLEHDPASGDLLLDEVPGIGEKTRDRVARALAEHRARLEPPPPVPTAELVLAAREEPGPR